MVKSITITKSGDYTYFLNKPGEELTVTGRFALRGNEQLTINLAVIHAAQQTRATVSLKASLDDRSRAVIKGKIVVNPEAEQTESFLEERVLLLSSDATAEAVPDLEILNNEVKCSHAATVGRIDEEQIFYLNSRGIETNKAKQMIAEGFLV